MTDKRTDLEKKLAQAIDDETPDLLPQILSARQNGKGKIITMTQNTTIQKKHTFRNWAIGAAAALVVLTACVFGYRYQFAVVDTAVSIDVNPSIQLEVNRAEKVLAANPLNEDAAVLLDGMDLKGTNLKTAVNAVIGSMVQNGYLTDDLNSILLTVENNDPARQAQLQEELTSDIQNSLQQLSVSGSVFSQSLTQNQDLETIASQYGISQGKAYWVQQLIKADSTLSAETLAKLSINDLALLAEARGIGQDSYTGTADESAYIGTEKAKQIATEKAGGGEIRKIELDVEDGVMVYEGELVKDGVEYDFDIHATTGEILKWEKDTDDDRDDDHTGSSSQTTSGNGSSTSQAPSSSSQTTSAQDIGEEKARQIVLNKIPGATIMSFKRDTDDGRTVYEGEARLDNVEYDFEINAADGSILKWEEDRYDDYDNDDYNDHDDNDDDDIVSSQTAIGVDKARQVVLQKLPGATITSIELDEDDSLAVYEGEAVKNGAEYDFKVNAQTGSLISWEKED